MPQPMCSEFGSNTRAFFVSLRISLLRRLQAQTLPNANPPIGKIHHFSKFAVTFEPLMQFLDLLG